MSVRYQCLVMSLVSILGSSGASAEIPPQTIQKKGVKYMQDLSQRQQALISISAFAAVGDLEKLKLALEQGLDQGLSLNEIKALLVQVYAYAGFPRSLNALTAFMQVVEQRKAKGITDVVGKESQALPKDYQALKQGTDNQTKLVVQPVTGALFEFAPEIDEYLKAHLFGDIFSRDVLSWQDREIATISMLAAMSGTEGQLKSHVSMSLNIGITLQQLQAIQQILVKNVSNDAGEKLAKSFSQ